MEGYIKNLPNIELKGLINYMIMVTKEEKDYICENFPRAHIVRTMRQKSKRHRYYVEEAPAVMRYLASVRYPEQSKAVRNGSGKTTGRK